MYSKNDKEILEYLVSCYPEEGCGIILNKKGKLKFIPCKNEAEDPFNYFKIPAEEYIKASMLGDIHAIVHSHPDDEEGLSEKDIATSNFLGITYIAYSVPGFTKFVNVPNREAKPLLGRDYNFGINDCWSLVRDYYKATLDTVLPSINFEDDWWLKGLNYFDDLYDSFGFIEVEELKTHDVIIFSVLSKVPNHCGVYLGNGIFMHHAENRLSCRESLYSGWNKNITRYMRCKKFI